MNPPPPKHENIIDDDCVKPTAFQSERKKFNYKANFSFFGEVCIVDKKHRNYRKDWYLIFLSLYFE